MSLLFDQKEDLRLRMIDLQRRLSESEEERRKLEKTCDMLLKAFKEEERVHYRIINNKYEKFLEDCKLRRRRNDIILQSLCRIEDKARILFTKTERLKLLKNHYVSHLKRIELKKDELPSLSKESILVTSTPSKGNYNVENKRKSVHWKLENDGDEEFEISKSASSFSRNRSDATILTGTIRNSLKGDLLNHNRNVSRSSFQNIDEDSELLRENTRKDLESKNKLNSRKVSTDSLMKVKEIPVNPTLNDFHTIINKGGNDEFKRKDFSGFIEKDGEESFGVIDEKANSDIELNFKDLKNTDKLREKEMIKYQESIEKLKMVLPSNETYSYEQNDRKPVVCEESEYKIIEKDEIESNEKFTQKSKDDWVSQYVSPTSSLLDDMQKELKESEDQEVDGDEKEEDALTEGYDFPKGLDGVDYDNETYPESYYEQPTRYHNPSNIRSNVILEEDEYEQEAELQEKTELKDDPAKSFRETLAQNEPNSDLHEKGFSAEPLLPESKALKTPKEEEFSQNKGLSYENSNVNKSVEPKNDSICESYSEDQIKQTGSLISAKNTTNALRSNLVNLLESDSESFQIEHGEVASGNEDSDFDFSFHQN